MYYFKESEKEKVLQGRTITYLATKILYVNIPYLSTILAGKQGCSMRLAEDIAKCISPTTEINDCFVKKQ